MSINEQIALKLKRVYLDGMDCRQISLKDKADEIIKMVTAENNKSYQELILHVERKFPNETRHGTALRYIREAETHSETCASSSIKELKDGK